MPITTTDKTGFAFSKPDTMSSRWPIAKKGASQNDIVNQKQLEERVHYLEDYCRKLENQNIGLKREVASLTEENNELMNRLSRLAGEQLARNNPDLADLSDPNRPTKVAEKWSSLYTEEWLDAYEELKNKSQKNISRPVEKQLLDIAVMCFHQCQYLANEQMQILKTTLNDVENLMRGNDSTDTDCSQNKRILNSMVDKISNARFMDNIINAYRQRRRRDKEWILPALKACANNYIKRGGIHSKRVLSYVNKCAELCWYMCVHEPPMVIEYESYPGQEIDRNKFSIYSGSGTVVDFIVWPPLFLKRDNGLSILAKGTVQPVMPQSSTTYKLTRKRSTDKLDHTVHPVSIHQKGAGDSSMRGSTHYKSPKSTMKHLSGSTFIERNGNRTIDELDGNPPTGTNKPKLSISSRIVNPDRLLSSKPPHQYVPKSEKSKNSLLKTVRNSSGIRT